MLNQPKASTWRRLAKQVGTNGIVPPECDGQNVGSNSFWACAAPSKCPFMGSLSDRYEMKPDDLDDISSGGPSNDFAAPFSPFFYRVFDWFLLKDLCQFTWTGPENS